jgi:hypothetical protein
MTTNLADALRLLLVTDDALLQGRDPLAVALAAVAGGVTAVQLRLKTIPDRDLLALARTMVERLPVPLFINDRLDIALIVGAAGVHLGPDDIAPAMARRIAPRSLAVPRPTTGGSVRSTPPAPRTMPARRSAPTASRHSSPRRMADPASRSAASSRRTWARCARSVARGWQW